MDFLSTECTLSGTSVSVSFKFSENMSFPSKVEMVMQRHAYVVINYANFFSFKNGKLVKNVEGSVSLNEHYCDFK